MEVGLSRERELALQVVQNITEQRRPGGGVL